MKKKGNKYKVLNYSQVNFLDIRETEIISQDEIKNCFWYNIFSGKQFKT